MLDLKQETTVMRSEIDVLKSKSDNMEGAVARMTDLEATMNNMEKRMDEKLDFLMKTVAYQQGMLEATDARFRATHIIITGVAENEDTLGVTDKDRILKIIKKTKAFTSENLGDFHVKRIGDSQQQRSWPRALHVTLDSHDKQRKILECAKNLKGDPAYARIYIKKDKHPTVRFEQNRLRKKEKEEKEKPENRGRTITYDHKRRVLLKDNRVIDRFCPSFR